LDEDSDEEPEISGVMFNNTTSALKTAIKDKKAII